MIAHKQITCTCGVSFAPIISYTGLIFSKFCTDCRFSQEMAKRKAKLNKVVEVDVKTAKKGLKSKLAACKDSLPVRKSRKIDYSQKSISKLLGILTEHFNLFIRNRDRLPNNTFYCPTCKKLKAIKGDNYQACHCFPSTYAALRYNENNVWGGCKSCNYFKHGAGHEYNDWVRNKIGEKEYQMLLIIKDRPFKWDRFSVIEKIEYYKQKNKDYLLSGELF